MMTSKIFCQAIISFFSFFLCLCVFVFNSNDAQSKCACVYYLFHNLYDSLIYSNEIPRHTHVLCCISTRQIVLMVDWKCLLLLFILCVFNRSLCAMIFLSFTFSILLSLLSLSTTINSGRILLNEMKKTK